MKKRYIYIASIVLFVVLLVVYGIITSFNDHTYTCTVTGKDRVFSSNYKTYHDVIYCKDDQGNKYELETSNNLFRLKFNASDDFKEIETGSTYKFTVTGFQIRILSSYEGILTFEKIE